MSRQVLWTPLAAGAAIGLGSWLLGVVPPDAVLIAVLTAAVIAAPRMFAHPAPVTWPGPADETAAGGYYEIRRIGTMLRQRDAHRIGPSKINGRLRVLAQRRLARLGVGWDHVDARRLLGANAYDLLDRGTLPGGRSAMLDEAELVLDLLDDIDKPENDRPTSKGTT